ncbi:hypothetical protein CXB51_028941 [Gossypium anomalum]|uniref:Reverse transcriptase n=1 Tax=Gossypium anomalum TaxID=47600 RepID=A0A8J6CQM6_9ROSI|nr:hypothetical protein CXB51_028941 [Gossypium anomalum]
MHAFKSDNTLYPIPAKDVGKWCYNEGLSSLMRLTMKEGLMKGVKASRRGLEISHLLFANDCILFGEASKKGALVMKQILNEYEDCSGQCVNFNKSTIFHSSNTAGEVQAEIGSIPELKVGAQDYYHKEAKRELEGSFEKFWWQKGYGKKGINWCQWNHMCQSKEEGGMGFRSMGQFNIALLAKQRWRILNNPKSLVAQVFKAKYFPTEEFLNSLLGNNSSYTWKSIWASKGVLMKGICWKVGRGTHISVLNDAWIPVARNFRLSSVVNNLNDFKVADLIDNNVRELKRELIVNTFSEEVAGKILSLLLVKDPHDDFSAWNGEPLGEYSVLNAYKLLQAFENDPRAYALQTDYNYSAVRYGQPGEKETAYDARLCQSASGVVGEVLLSSSKIHQGLTLALAVKALACHKAVQIGIVMQWPKIIVERDSLTKCKRSSTYFSNRNAEEEGGVSPSRECT